MNARLEWRGEQVMAGIAAKLAKNMGAATLYVQGQTQRKLNRGNARGTDPSKPGEPPKKVTGRLFQSITTRVVADMNSVRGQIGTNVEYARRLELGFTGTDSRGAVIDQAPRPFLRPALIEAETAIKRILTR